MGGALVERGMLWLVKAVGLGERCGLDVCICGVSCSTALVNVGELQGAIVPELVCDRAVLGGLIRELVYWVELRCRFCKNARARSKSV